MTGENKSTSPVRMIVISELLIVLVIALSLFAFKALYARKPEVEQKEIETVGLNVDVYSAQDVNFREILMGFGTARADREVTMAAQVTGEIVDINPQLKVGYRVAADEMLLGPDQTSRRQAAELMLRIDPRDYRQRLEQTANRIAEAKTEIEQLKVQQANVDRQLKKSRLVLATLQEEYDRVKRAMKLKAASSSDLNRSLLDLQRYEDTVIQLENQAASLPHQIVAAEQRLLTGKSEQTRAEDELERTEVRPPFSGVISEVFVEKGQYVRAGEQLLRLTDLTTVEVPISLSFDDFLQLDEALTSGQKPKVSLAENETSDPRWTGFVARASPEADTVSRTVQVYVEIDNTAENAPLLAGAFVHARIDGSDYQNAMLIPREAIVDGQVYVIDEQGKARRRQVESGRHFQSMVAVEEGIQEGDQIAITNLDILEDGRDVVVQSVRQIKDELALIRSPKIRLQP